MVVMVQDLRFGMRSLRRSPGFTLLAIFCLTLGIGATTSVFSWIEGILLRPYPLFRLRTAWSRYRDGPERPHRYFLARLRRPAEKLHASRMPLSPSTSSGTTLSIGERADEPPERRLGQLFPGTRHSSDSWASSSTRSRIPAATPIPSPSSVIKPGGPLRSGPGDHWQIANPERRETHYHRRGAAEFFRNLCRLFFPILGSAIDGGCFRRRHL